MKCCIDRPKPNILNAPAGHKREREILNNAIESENVSSLQDAPSNDGVDGGFFETVVA
jgi:hypothetical protein